MSSQIVAILMPEEVARMAAATAEHQAYPAALARVIDLNTEREARR